MAANITPSNYGAIWNLNPETTTVPKTEGAFPLGAKEDEVVIGIDGRTIVNQADYSDGGKYRAIIKLFVRYEKQPNDNVWGMGTGWLIAPDLLVTAGHVAFDFGLSTNYGKATIVKAYMGYSGAVNLTPANLLNNSVQLQYGSTFITTTGWLQSAGQAERADVAFLKLAKPFTGNFKPFSYVDTPLTGTAESIGVVGYPADKVNSAGEDGANMYQMSAPVTWNLDTTVGNLLQYTISSYPGQSGSPVIRQSDGAVIGVHVLGGTRVNSASDINGKYGNMFDSFVRAFSENSTPIGNILNVNIIKPQTVGPDNLNLATIVNTTGSGSATESSLGGGGTEGFLDILKDIGKVALPLVSTGLQVASPFLGPLGPPAATIGGVALGALSKACESAFNTSTESFHPATLPSDQDLHGCAERAILAESALQTALKLDSSSPQGQQILADMASTYSTLQPMEALHSKLFPAIAGPTLRIALNDTLVEPPTESSIQVRKPLPGAAGVESSLGDSLNAPFAKELLQPTIALPGEEGFFDDIGSVISTGLQFATPIIGALARSSVESALSASTSPTESALTATTPDTVISLPLFRRAIVAECALQAVQKIDIPTLKAMPLYDEEGNPATEGFFDDMKTTMQTIGRKVLDTAPDVIRNVGPIALNLVANAIQKQGSGGGSGNEGNLPNPGGLTVHPVSIAALADSRPGTPNPPGRESSVSEPQLLSSMAASVMTAPAPRVGFAVEGSEVDGPQFKTTGFHNLDGLSFIRAPWEENADQRELS